MRPLSLILALVGVSLASDSFEDFSRKFHKKYESTEEMNKRREIFLENFKDVARHNQDYEEGKVSWRKKINQWSDLSPDEFSSQMTPGLSLADLKEEMIFDTADLEMEEMISRGSAPEEWSWVEQGGVSAIKDQKECGSCGVFASVAAIETCLWLAEGRQGAPPELSEQHLMDCAKDHVWKHYGANGCHGDWPIALMDWAIRKNDGLLQRQSCAPYKGQDMTCKDRRSCNYVASRLTGFKNRFNGSEDEMKQAVYIMPVATIVDAATFGSYHDGVFDDPRCCNHCKDWRILRGLHEVAVVGYGTEKGMDYWLLKNSWGTEWGDNGYMKIKRGTGHCGIGSHHFIQPTCKM